MNIEEPTIRIDDPPPEPPKKLSDSEITAHTASLWNYVPVDESGFLPHAEYSTDFLQIGASAAICASVRGKKHKHDGSNRDDWYTVENADGWAVLAVSDGAGSKTLSRIGARVSCETAADTLKTALLRLREEEPSICDQLASPMTEPAFQSACAFLAKAVQDAVIAARSAVTDTAEQAAQDDAYTNALGRAAAVNDFSATLLLAAAIPLVIDEKTEQLVITCQIGDGMIALVTPDAPFESAAKLLCEPDSGDFAGETDFLTSEKVSRPEQLMPRTRISRGQAGCLLLMTDGVSDDYYPAEPQVRRLYLDLLINGILSDGKKPVPITPPMLRILKNIEKPTAYPWVNDPTQSLSLYSMEEICSQTALSLADAWKLQSLWCHSAAIARPLRQLDAPEQRLCKWLDHYVRRGSFDDRTLVILSFEGGETP